MAAKKQGNSKVKKAVGGIAAKKRLVKSAKPMTLEEWLGNLHSRAKDLKVAGEPAGACLVTDPQTGSNACILTDMATCKALKGTFIGGPCGS
jgi:hypothetical protein